MNFDIDPEWNSILWRQIAAALEMLENALNACPEQAWQARLWNLPTERPDLSQYWYIAFHALFWLDLYLSGKVEGFAPPAPFGLEELDPAGLLPERPYTRAELLAYLNHDRNKCRDILQTLTGEGANRACKFAWGEISYAELLLDTLRHVQEHTAQLNLYLGQTVGSAPGWVTRPKRGV